MAEAILNEGVTNYQIIIILVIDTFYIAFSEEVFPQISLVVKSFNCVQ